MFSYNKTILTGIIALGYKIIYKEKKSTKFFQEMWLYARPYVIFYYRLSQNRNTYT